VPRNRSVLMGIKYSFSGGGYPAPCIERTSKKTPESSSRHNASPCLGRCSESKAGRSIHSPYFQRAWTRSSAKAWEEGPIISIWAGRIMEWLLQDAQKLQRLPPLAGKGDRGFSMIYVDQINFTLHDFNNIRQIPVISRCIRLRVPQLVMYWHQ
jgi:hypothetical protein